MPRLPLESLPAWPRRLPAPLAAIYLGISESKLHAGVKNGSYPAPQFDGRRRLWDRLELDRWVDSKGQAAAGSDPLMERILAASQAPARQRRQATR